MLLSIALSMIPSLTACDGTKAGKSGDTASGGSDTSGATNCQDGEWMNPAFVGPNVEPDDADGSFDRPYSTFAEAFEMNADCVGVLPATYSESIVLPDTGAYVYAYSAGQFTTIEGDGLSPAVSIWTGESTMDGLIITGGGGYLVESQEDYGAETADIDCYHGGGIMVGGGSLTLMDMDITGNELPPFSSVFDGVNRYDITKSKGGGVFVMSGTLLMDNVRIEGNMAAEGGGIFVEAGAAAAIGQGIIRRNWAEYGGGFATMGDLTATNTIISRNESQYGAGGLVYGTANLGNVVIVGNDGVALVFDFGAGGFLKNSIVSANTFGGIYGTADNDFTSEYSNVYDNAGSDYNGFADPAGSNGNISADPMFSAWSDDGTGDDDLSLAPGSPSIDAGNPDSAQNDVDGTRNDMGAYGGPDGGDW